MVCRPLSAANIFSNLRRFLDYELLLASVLQDRDPAVAYKIALFVLRMTEGIPKALDYYARASAFTTSRGSSNHMDLYSQALTLPVLRDVNTSAPMVPKLDLSIAQQVLNARLQAAEDFDNAFRDLQTKNENTKNIRLFVTIALESSVDSEQAYNFMADMASQRFYAAQESLVKSQKEFQTLQLSLADRQQAFKDGIEKWKRNNIIKAVAEGLFAVAAIAGSIAVACVAPPAGAAGIAAGAAGVGKAVEGVAAAAQQIGKMAKIIEVIKNIYDKLKPGLEKAEHLVTALKTIIKLTSSLKTIDEAAEKTIKALSMPCK
jgi:cell division protein ZapA (FtsZ GTPase activity inhibitor)